MKSRMRYKANALRLIGLCAVVALPGCSLSRGAPAQQHYVLGGGLLQENEAPSSGALGGLAIGVRRLQLASYLQSPSVVVRRGARAQEISLSEFHRWGEPLGEGINRALAGYLAAKAPFPVVQVAPWPLRAQHDYLVQVDVLRFEGVAPEELAGTKGVAHLLATWMIIRPGDGEVLARGTTDYRESSWRVGDHGHLVTLLDAGLSVLSENLVAGIAGLGAPQAARESPTNP